LQSKVALNFSWFFQGSKAVVFFFLIYTTYHYGHIHLGHDKGKTREKPEFSNISYFAMIFAAGVGPAALVYGVLEPLSHQESNFFANAGYHSQDEIDMFGINMAISNWSILTFTYSTLIAVCMSLATHRFRLPMTYRTCYYPIFGAYTWGWIGDVIDAVTAVVTILGACIFLKLAVTQITAGLMYIGWIDELATAKEVLGYQNILVWVVTIISTASVISGLRGAVQLVSLAAVLLGTVLTFLVFAMDDTKYILNLQVQEVGYFLQHSLFELNFWTDAFAQLREGSGRAVDGKAAEEWWMGAWLTFYASWQ
jgi:choline-glycine betaine transporter